VKKQLHIFLTALMFYTRIPCPKWVDHNADYLNKATIYFPSIGYIVGLISGVVCLAALSILPTTIAVLLSVAAGVFTTGAFHEDGFADVCDGFGGGWTKAKILSIMKDSRVGTYGIVGLGLLMAVKVAAITQLLLYVEGKMFILFLICAHTLSRWCAATTLYTHQYSRENEDSKAKPMAKKMSSSQLLITTLFMLVPFALVLYKTEYYYFLLIIPTAYLFKAYLARYFKKWLDGYTGDCLGAIQQVTEVVFYLSFLVLWSFF